MPQDLEESDIEQARRMAPVAFSGVLVLDVPEESDSRDVLADSLICLVFIVGLFLFAYVALSISGV